LKSEGAVRVWSFGSGSGDGVRMSAVALPPLGPAHHHIDLPAAAAGTDEPLAQSRTLGVGAIPSSHLSGIGLDLRAHHSVCLSYGPTWRPSANSAM
jgi:hypothetical protein